MWSGCPVCIHSLQHLSWIICSYGYNSILIFFFYFLTRNPYWCLAKYFCCSVDTVVLETLIETAPCFQKPFCSPHWLNLLEAGLIKVVLKTVTWTGAHACWCASMLIALVPGIKMEGLCLVSYLVHLLRISRASIFMGQFVLLVPTVADFKVFWFTL